MRAARPRKRALFGAFFVFIVLATAPTFDARAATLIVTNGNDSGAGTLRQAILDANNNFGVDNIVFDIPGTNVHTIPLATPLPPITEPAVIDGTTQSGFTTNNKPVIEINGTSAGAQAGLRLIAGGTTVRGLAINRCGTDGIDISGAGTNIIQGNFIGTDPGGTISRGNAFEGIYVLGSPGNIIGGTNVADRNLISANGDGGIYVQGANGNVIQGNFIGTGIGGGGRIPNGNHGIIVSGGSGNVLGGTATGSRNLVSGNTGSGVFLSGASTTATVIQGNYIGTDITGSLVVSNAGYGISIVNAPANIVGGTNAGAGNLISGNSRAGVDVSGATAASNLIQGNLIGTDVTGKIALGNTLAGISMSSSVTTTIGGTVTGARNVISANKQDGILIGTNSARNTIQGNYIGQDVTGTNSLANTFNGISINSANSNTIGGTISAARNVISGNANYGIQIYFGASSNLVQGNYVGTDATGARPRANSLSGIRIESANNTVGGTSAGARNVISGNLQDGVYLMGSAATGNLVQGNYVGTDAGGTFSLRNYRGGIGISAAPGNTIGGTVTGAGNLISGNGDPGTGDAGVYLISSGATGNFIQGNLIGTDFSGMSALGNSHEGIYLEAAPTNTIGGSAAGAGNVISANNTRGIFLVNAPGTVIQGNLIGTKSDGVSTMGNTFHAVECEAGASHTSVGGAAAGAGNRIAFTQTIYAGVRVRSGSTNNAIRGNSIYSNGALGIDLDVAGFGINDGCDADGGANMQQNYPVVTQAVSGNGTGVRGTLNSRANTTFLLQFFASPTCDTTGYGEGQIYLGETSVLTSNTCNGSFVASLDQSVPVGYVLTATATDPANNTSEFSACFPISSVPTLRAIPASNNQVQLSWTNTATGFVLKQSPSLNPPILWSTATNVPAVSNGQFVVTQTMTSSNRFFLLRFE